MRRHLLWVGACFILCSSSGCVSDPREDYLKEGITLVNEMADLLSHVRDEESAKQWKPRCKMIKKRLGELKEKASKLDKPKEEDVAGILERHGKDFDASMDRLKIEGTRLQSKFESAWDIIKEEVPDKEIDFNVKVDAMGGPGGMGGMGGMGGGGKP